MMVRPPWWFVAVLGLACTVLGGVLIADPFDSIHALKAVVAATLALTGVTSIVAAGLTSRPWLPRAAGAAWVVAGIVILAWPDITIRELAITVGFAVVAGGVFNIGAALLDEGEGRFLLGVDGAGRSCYRPPCDVLAVPHGPCGG